MNQETSSVRPTISPVYYLKRIPGCGTRQGDSGIAWQTFWVEEIELRPERPKKQKAEAGLQFNPIRNPKFPRFLYNKIC